MDIKERLEKTLDKVNKEYFSNGDIPTIRLSKGQDKKNRRAIVFGTYHAQKNEIKIHPVLLQEEVEDFVLEFIIYHEMLHYEDRDELLIRKKGQLVHTSRFKQREKYFRQYEEAQEILKNILHGRELVKGSEESTENTEKIESSKTLTDEEKMLLKIEAYTLWANTSISSGTLKETYPILKDIYENIKNTLVFQLLQRILKDYDPLPLRTALW
jgi:predicted SprT family Zn-dependent metalloprotease